MFSSLRYENDLIKKFINRNIDNIMLEKEQLNITATKSPEQEINKQKEIIAVAGNNVRVSLEALEKLGINVPERHNVLVPGTPTTPENSKLLLKRAIEECSEIGVYLGITVCPYICKFCRYYNRTGSLKNLDKMAASDAENVIKEMEVVDRELELSKKPKTNSVYIGGGTPTLMSKESMERVFENLHKFYDINKDAEITM